MDYQLVLGLIAASVSVFSYYLYLRDVFKGSTKPHVFSWVVWALITGIGCGAQVFDGGGPGAFALGVSSFFCMIISLIAIKKGEHSITKSDWFAFTLALCAIPAWILTKSPLYSVIIISIVDMFAFYPTFRKSYFAPHTETLGTYALANVEFIISLFALTHFTFITSFYTLTVITLNSIFISMVIYRRLQLK